MLIIKLYFTYFYAAAAAAALLLQKCSRIVSVLQYNSKMQPNISQFMCKSKLNKNIVAVSEVSTSATAATVAAALLNSAAPAATPLEKRENMHAHYLFCENLFYLYHYFQLQLHMLLQMHLLLLLKKKTASDI